MAAPATAAPAARGAAITPDYSVEGFDYDASVLTLEGGDVAGDHVRFITLYPELRHKVLNGLALAHPELLDEAMERLHRLEQARGIEDDEKKDTEQAAADAGSEARSRRRRRRRRRRKRQPGSLAPSDTTQPTKINSRSSIASRRASAWGKTASPIPS
jgi:beta-glucosidase-like glycosyl hydrolase